ncbi:hypothetical protein [Ureaplasma diversum]|uniref:Uncharacterized protein n=1 Tax=Ureaplasma diversum NCTC 246 TaxID=1188241 RepID=A0A084EXH7_9BACT|nr:hypothetical protein [Ureaplasma diversum]KEZ22669.1 Hypothetical protein, predicted transmembrane protein [Ureaplasma diversum NCTC 246]
MEKQQKKEIVKTYFSWRKESTSHHIQQLVISAIFLALFLVARILTKNIDFIASHSWQLQMLVFCVGIYAINSFYYKLFFFIIAPLLMLVFGFSAEPFFGYLAPHYSFFSFLFLDLIEQLINKPEHKKINPIINYGLIVVFSVFSYILVWIFYAIQGVLFYQVSWIASFSFNAPISFVSMGINLAIGLVLFPAIYLLKQQYNKKKITY